MQNLPFNLSATLAFLAAGTLAACGSPESEVLTGDSTFTYPLSSKSGSGGYASKAFEAASLNTSPILQNKVTQGALESTDVEMDTGTYADFHTYTGKAGELLRITLDSSDVDPFVAVLIEDENGEATPIAYDDDGGPGLNSMVEVELPVDGEYQIMVISAAPPHVGSYDLRVIAEAPTVFPKPGDAAGKYALLVGAGNYSAGTDNDLPAVATDLGMMRDLLIDELGFKPENIVMLQDARATSAGVIRGFREHLSTAGPEGVAFFYYSGHGTQVGANIGMDDAESDGNDEALFMADGGYLLDDDIAFLRNELKTENVMVVIDACHSGTASMVAGDMYIKEVKAEDLGPILRKGATAITEGAGIASEENAIGDSGHVLIGSSRDIEPSICAGSGTHLPEALTEESVSIFTYCFVLALRIEGNEATLATVLETTYEAMSEYLVLVGADQQPQIIGKQQSRTVGSFFQLK